ncbi:NHLP leader peptide family RiPP precursor [Pelodictyon luteolum]|uniref:NHLP leader peptide family RiPP precursor n=1 Tax=Pelodictyon luteolum TaxID=1100 RepID=UPI000674F57D|nr:NHLP leader peptide family RiPP precursor [Pelodictyon luteolum]
MEANEHQQALGKIIAKAWADEGFKQQFIENPAEILNAEGISVPEGMKVSVVEDTAACMHIILPVSPDIEMDGAALNSVAGGGSCCGGSCSSCWDEAQ